MKNFIIKIQDSDETTKKIWLFVLSGITMVIVISLWFVYLDLTVARVAPAGSPATELVRGSQPSLGAANLQEAVGSDEPGFFAIFGTGVKVIYDKVSNAILSAKNLIVIESPQRNFVAEEIKPVEGAKLP